MKPHPCIETLRTFASHILVAVRRGLPLLTVAIPAGNLRASPVVRTGSGANAAAIQAVVDQFRTDLGGVNNGVGGTFKTGRREINWDGVPDTSSAPNFMPVDFFNATSPRGVIFSSNKTFGDTSSFVVSADSSNPTTTAVRFGNLDASYTAIFKTFSAERLFLARNNTSLSVSFFVPGTSIPATVKGFGAVFTDVDQAGPTYIKYYGPNGKFLTFQSAPVSNNGLSFAGVSFNAAEQVARVEIVCGTEIAASGTVDGQPTASVDVVAMDDFIYSEPQPLVVPVAATAPLPAAVIEAHIPMSLTGAASQAGVPAGFFRTAFRCSPHHPYRFFTSTDLINWTPAAISGNAAGTDVNLLDPRAATVTYNLTTLSVTVDVQKSGPNRFYRAVDQLNAESIQSALIP